jgi:spermidine synthase
MITHIPMFATPTPPKRVLIIGGGDGGVLREVLKHASVESVQQCEIDQLVVEMSKTYFSATLATSFCDPRVTLIYKDAVQYCQELNDRNAMLGNNEDLCKFDCIICDSSDPVGPAADLFSPAFYRSMSTLLSDQGTVPY